MLEYSHLGFLCILEHMVICMYNRLYFSLQMQFVKEVWHVVHFHSCSFQSYGLLQRWFNIAVTFDQLQIATFWNPNKFMSLGGWYIVSKNLENGMLKQLCWCLLFYVIWPANDILIWHLKIFGAVAAWMRMDIKKKGHDCWSQNLGWIVTLSFI